MIRVPKMFRASVSNKNEGSGDGGGKKGFGVKKNGKK